MVKVREHLFEDGETVILKETGEKVTVKQWWFGDIRVTKMIARYDILEFPGTWFSEYELEKIK